MPFVRDSKLATTLDSKASNAPKAKAPAPAPAPAPVPVPVPSAAPKNDPLASAVEAKGKEVRQLKEAKADKEVINAAVAELLALKRELAEANGSPLPPQNEQKQKERSTPSKQKADPQAALPPKVPVSAPNYVTPAPTPDFVVRSSLADSIFSDKEEKQVDMVKLDLRLQDYSYVTGFRPAASDAKVFAAIQGKDASAFPNISRWQRHIASFNSNEQSTWK